MRRFGWALFLALASAGACDCSNNGGGGTGGGDAGGQCTSTLQCPDPQICDPGTGVCTDVVACTDHLECGNGAYCGDTQTCQPSQTGSPCAENANCGTGTCTGGFCGCVGEQFAAERVPPNVLIVLDRSSSMNEDGDPSTSGTQSKWSIALDAIPALVNSFGSSVRFGLAMYPGTQLTCESGNQCSSAGAVFVDPGDPIADITSTLNSATTCMLGTPTDDILRLLIDYPGLEDTTRANYVLLITDGQANCGDPVPVAADLLAEAPSVGTFVVGFGGGVDTAELDGLAINGGTAIGNGVVGGTRDFYDATDATQLGQVLAQIGGTVQTCDYTLSTVPADLTDLFVYQDGAEVTRDQSHAEGWDYNTSTNLLTFYGNACDALLAGTVGDLVIVYGCPIVPL